MRLAVSGSHGTGKSTLIAEFLRECPGYQHEPEAFEVLGDDVDLTPSEGPTAEGLELLLEHTMRALEGHGSDACVVFERSPVDYLAYAVAARSWPRGQAARFLETFIPRVRDSLGHLDLIVFLPVSEGGPRPSEDENPRFRRRVDEALRRALIDDDFGLLQEPGSPTVVELPSEADLRLARLLELARSPVVGRQTV